MSHFHAGVGVLYWGQMSAVEAILKPVYFRFLMIAALILAGPATQAAAETNESSIKDTLNTPLKVAFISDNQPWTFSQGENSNNFGLTHELIYHTLNQLGHAIEAQFMTPRRVSATLLGDHTDAATLMVSPSGAVLPPDNFECSKPYLDVPWHLYYRSSTDHNIKTEELLLGVVKYPGYEDYYKEFPIVFSAYKSNLQLYRSLKAERIHGIISNSNLMGYWQRELDLDVVQGEYLGYTHMTMCFSKTRLGAQAQQLATAFTPTLFKLMDQQPPQFSKPARDLFLEYHPTKDGNPDFEYVVEDARKTPTSNRKRETGGTAISDNPATVSEPQESL